MKKPALWLFVILMRFCIAAEHHETFLEPIASDHVIEMIVEKPQQDHYPAIILLHGLHNAGCKSMTPFFNYWLEQGFAVGAISMPGFGKSSGTRDFCGPSTLHALNVAIDKIKRELEISEFVLMGFGPGGLAAVLLATQREDMTCIIATHNVFDLLQHKGEQDPLMTFLQNQGYDFNFHDDLSLMARSPIYHIDKITAPIFLLHRKQHPTFDEQDAIAFHQAMLAEGKECQLVIKDKSPGQNTLNFSLREVMKECGSWLSDFVPGNF